MNFNREDKITINTSLALTFRLMEEYPNILRYLLEDHPNTELISKENIKRLSLYFRLDEDRN